jgi:hypothetical protein
VTANAFFRFVRLDDHRQRVPSHQTLDPAFDLAAARKRRLLGGWDAVDVRGVGGEGLPDALLAGVMRKVAEQAADPRRSARLQNIIERLEPFTRFDGLELRCVLRCSIAHDSSGIDGYKTLFYYSFIF